jgi:cell division cycle protein 20 (cofactor of APC complex)
MIIGKPKTPGKAPKTPSAGDRFIPNRNATQFDLGHFKIMNDGKTENADLLSPSQQQYQKVMSENLNGADIMSNKIISCKSKAPSAPEGRNNVTIHEN